MVKKCILQTLCHQLVFMLVITGVLLLVKDAMLRFFFVDERIKKASESTMTALIFDYFFRSFLPVLSAVLRCCGVMANAQNHRNEKSQFFRLGRDGQLADDLVFVRLYPSLGAAPGRCRLRLHCLRLCVLGYQVSFRFLFHGQKNLGSDRQV